MYLESILLIFCLLSCVASTVCHFLKYRTVDYTVFCQSSDTFCKYTDVFYYPEIPEGQVSSWFEARLIIRSSFSTKRHLYWVLTRDICLSHTSRNNEYSI